MNLSQYPFMLNATHVAEILGVSRPTAYKVMSQPNFPRVRLYPGKKSVVRVTKPALIEWIESTQSA